MNSLCLLVWVASTREVSFAICVQYEDVLDEEPQYQTCRQKQQEDEKTQCVLLAGSFCELVQQLQCVRNGVEILL